MRLCDIDLDYRAGIGLLVALIALWSGDSPNQAVARIFDILGAPVGLFVLVLDKVFALDEGASAGIWIALFFAYWMLIGGLVGWGLGKLRPKRSPKLARFNLGRSELNGPTTRQNIPYHRTGGTCQAAYGRSSNYWNERRKRNEGPAAVVRNGGDYGSASTGPPVSIRFEITADTYGGACFVR